MPGRAAADFIEIGFGARLELLGHSDRCDSEHRRTNWQNLDHEMAATNFSELDTEPNTPPCILIIFTACS